MLDKDEPVPTLASLALVNELLLNPERFQPVEAPEIHYLAGPHI
jgi:hypothetical protein